MGPVEELMWAFESDEDFGIRLGKMPEFAHAWERRMRFAAQWEIRSREAQTAAINRLAAALEAR